MNANQQRNERLEEVLLKRLARRYMWRWPEQKALERQQQLVAQVMDIGTFDDANALLLAVGESAFREVLANAEPGWLSPRSWAYWHYRLGLAAVNSEPPDLPRRFR
jgi:hypothetical protein